MLLPALLALAACATRPEPALQVVEGRLAGENATPVELFAVTTRRPSPDEGLRFSGERTLMPRFARMVISVPKNRPTGEIQWPDGTTADPAGAFRARAFEQLEIDAFRQRLGQSIGRKRERHVLIFVHGYNTRFDEAAFRLAQIVHDSGAEVTPVLFSWASWASVGAYPYDRESATLGRDSLEALIERTAAQPGVTQVSILAHSMGGFLTLESLRQMVIRRGTLPPKLRNVMLAAPDVDVDVAMAQGRVIRQARHRPQVTLFVSTDDKALSAARWLWGSRDRLGAINPSMEPYRTNLENSGVSVIDLSEIRTVDTYNHGKFAASPAIVQLIGQRLASGQDLETQRAGSNPLTDFVQGTTRAAGAVLTVPLRIGEAAAPPGSGLSE
ncbi:MAG: esterase [Methylobacterium sp.]|nr:MAG: esterase [Methylobacterium sp.]